MSATAAAIALVIAIFLLLVGLHYDQKGKPSAARFWIAFAIIAAVLVPSILSSPL